MNDLKKRYTVLNKMDSNSLSMQVTLNKWGCRFNSKYYGKPKNGEYISWFNIWGKDSDGYYDEDEIIEGLKAKVCKSIDAQREVIVSELKKAGVYEPADV